MIWDFIRDFLVQYIFGGTDSNLDVYRGFVGNLFFDTDGSIEIVDEYTDGLSFVFKDVYLGNWGGLGNAYISIGDWLSTTTTIIIMFVIVFLFAMLVRWVYKTVVSAFLLR